MMLLAHLVLISKHLEKFYMKGKYVNFYFLITIYLKAVDKGFLFPFPHANNIFFGV